MTAATGAATAAGTGAAARGLERPAVLDALRGLSRLVGPEDALRAWQRAATATGCHGTDLSPEQLLAVAGQLRLEGGLAAVFATSLSARVRAWTVLSRTPPPGADR